MENSLTKQIDESTDENFVIVRQSVDSQLTLFEQKYSEDERNELILDIFKLVDTKFEHNKKLLIATLVKSYIIRKIHKDKKDLENTD